MSLSLHPHCALRKRISDLSLHLRGPILFAAVNVTGTGIDFPHILPRPWEDGRRLVACRKTEDGLSAIALVSVGTGARVPGNPHPLLASEHQNFTFTTSMAALIANIDRLSYA